MLARTKNAFLDFKYEFAIIAMLCIPAIRNFECLKSMIDGFYPFYLVDFSMGINSRMLVGSVVSLLTDHPTEEWLNWFARIVLFLGMLLTAVVLGRVIRATKAEDRNILYVFILMFTFGTLTLDTFFYYMGFLDIHMYIIALLGICFANNRYLRWLIPVLCVAGVFVNYVFIISYFPIVLLIVLHLAERKEDKKTDVLIFVLSIVLTLASTYYCVFLGKYTMNITFDELWELIEKKSGIEFDFRYVRYFDYYLFGNDVVEAEIGVELSELSNFEFVIALAKTLIDKGTDFENLIMIFIVAIPVLVMFLVLWILCVKSAERKSRKFIYICFMLSELLIIPCCLLSTDTIRWVSSGVISQFAFCFYMFYDGDKSFGEAANKFKNFFIKNKLALIALLLFYMLSPQFSVVAKH